MYNALIIGSGLAGMSCGFELASKGHKVLILEANSYLGGRTASWDENGMEVESGLHRFLGFYEELPEFLHNCGIIVDDIVDWINEAEIKLPNNKSGAILAFSPSEKPLEMLADILGNLDFFPLEDKIGFSKFLVAGVKDYKLNPQKLDSFTVLEYAKKHKLTDRLINGFLTALTEGIFFLSPHKYSAFQFFSIIVPYIPNLHKVGEGAFKGGMTEVMMNPVAEAIKERDGEIRTNQKVQRLLVENNQVKGVATEHEQILTKHVVIATGLSAAKRQITDSFEDLSGFKDLLSLESMPAVTVQIELYEPALPTDRPVFSPGTAMASYAEQSRTTFQDQQGRLSIILASPEKYLYQPPEKVLEDVKEAAHKLDIKLSKIKDYRVIAHPSDFYALIPGSEELRPSQKTLVRGLTLTGDYTKQPYIATMEGAVVAGKRAAEYVTNAL